MARKQYVDSDEVKIYLENGEIRVSKSLVLLKFGGKL